MAMACNPVRNVDPTGMDWYIFGEDQKYQETMAVEGTDRMAVKSVNEAGNTVYTFYDFNDPENDAKSIDNGEITQFEPLSDATVDNMMNASGVRSDAARNSPWSYAKNEATGKMDYGVQYGNLSKNTFYVRENTAYNVGDIGNYLWGMGMAELGFDLGTAKMGAHTNNALFGRGQFTGKYDFGNGTYKSPGFWDSLGDQRAITKGYSNSPLGKSRLEYQKK